jgi:hypothetical protein
MGRFFSVFNTSKNVGRHTRGQIPYILETREKGPETLFTFPLTTRPRETSIWSSGSRKKGAIIPVGKKEGKTSEDNLFSIAMVA